MKSVILVLLLSSSLAVNALGQSAVNAAKKPCPTPKSIEDAKYHPGQVWAYQTRQGEEDSTLTVLRVESLPKVGTIVHVRLDGVRLRNCTGGPEPDTIQHAPFTRTAIDRSATKLLKQSSTIPDFAEGYQDWREHCGGVYTITPSEMVRVDEITFSKNLGCELPEKP